MIIKMILTNKTGLWKKNIFTQLLEIKMAWKRDQLFVIFHPTSEADLLVDVCSRQSPITRGKATTILDFFLIG